MVLPLFAGLSAGFQALKVGLPLGIKALKYFVDSTFRDKVVPVPGSVLYCDLWVAVEHSGIYVGDGIPLHTSPPAPKLQPVWVSTQGDGGGIGR